jgi:hypothetical protein
LGVQESPIGDGGQEGHNEGILIIVTDGREYVVLDISYLYFAILKRLVELWSLIVSLNHYSY